MTSIFSFSENIKPVSVNQAVRHGRNGSYKSKAFETFVTEINKSLTGYKRPCFTDRSPLRLDLKFTIPKEEYFTKQGVIALKHDLDNLQKYTIDAIAKYCGFNDAIVTELNSKKLVGHAWTIEAEIFRIEEVA